MKKLSLIIVSLLVVLVCCKKTPQVNIQYVDVEREVLTIGQTTATIQCDYEYMATLKSARLYYGKTESNMHSVNMRVAQSVLYAEITGLSASTTYKYYYEFENGFNSMQSEVETFVTESIPVSLPTVITADVSEIAANSAVCGGEVTSDGGCSITARGVCWGISPNPTLSDSFTTDGTDVGSFVSNMTGLSSSTTYHVRAYAVNEVGTAYGLDKEFVSGCGCGDEYVDLGLPSGLLWATCNIGASCPEDYGEYFAWGETSPKNYYDYSNYIYCMGSAITITKYCFYSGCGYNGYTDNLIILLPEDDAATVNWGNSWRMPTWEEWLELCQNTTITWTTQNGIHGGLFTASNGNTMFIPAAGNIPGNTICEEGKCTYWSSSLHLGSTPNAAHGLGLTSNNYTDEGRDRAYGMPVRAVFTTSLNN